MAAAINAALKVFINDLPVESGMIRNFGRDIAA
jgi:hypothetical protein